MSMEGIANAVARFRVDGYGVIDNFLTVDEVNDMKREMHRIVDDMNPAKHAHSVFVTDDPAQHVADTYFMESVDKIRFFYEDGALDADGQLLVDKQHAFNKIGHALHWLNPVFRRVSFSSRIAQLMHAIGYQSPAIVQGMYIFKHAGIGGSVCPHYDATFLQADPIKNSMGLWFALDDATIDNGCLWFAAGSHINNTNNYRFNRQSAGKLLAFDGDKPDFDARPYTACPVRAGSVVLIHGLTWHKSAANTSDRQRHAFTLHIAERHNTVWLPQNWLQENDDYKFPGIYENVIEDEHK